jgi:tetratricopeptide (TPR) repeat protein
MRIDWMDKYLYEAEQLIFDNQINDGIALLQNLLYEEPGYGGLHNYLGWAYMYYTADREQAELHLQMAIKFDDQNPAPFIHMGNLMMRDNRYAEAIHYLKQGLQKPSASRVTFLEAIGQAWELRGNFSEAMKAYREAMLISVTDHEMTCMTNHVARVRKKRWASFWRT